MFSLERAIKYISENKSMVNDTYRLKFHFCPPIGWMNDPNGLIYYNNQYHIFYQYYPYDSKWGSMHWGHAVSDDLIRFQDCKIALAPDRPDETGCFSGGAIVNINNPDELVLMYTRHYNENGVIEERQAIATSKDGINFHKRDKAVIDIKDIPHGSSLNDFRDPKPVYIDGSYYIFIGSKSSGGVGQIIVYRSEDLKSYEYFMTIGPGNLFGEMGECPDFVKIGGKDVLIASSVALKRQGDKFLNVNSSLYFAGKFDIKNKAFIIEKSDEIDCGHDFYAPQLLVDPKGRVISLAWMEMWNKEHYLHKNNHGWNGALTFPRVLSLDNDSNLIQTPIEEISNYYGNRLEFCNDGLIQRTLDAEFTFNISQNISLKLANTENDLDYIEVGVKNGRVFYNPENCLLEKQSIRQSKTVYSKNVKVRMLLDVSSIELFIEDGKETITSRFYIPGGKLRFKICGSDKDITFHNAYEITT